MLISYSKLLAIEINNGNLYMLRLLAIEFLEKHETFLWFFPVHLKNKFERKLHFQAI